MELIAPPAWVFPGLIRGFQDAKAGLPFDDAERPDWKEGHRLYGVIFGPIRDPDVACCLPNPPSTR